MKCKTTASRRIKYILLLLLLIGLLLSSCSSSYNNYNSKYFSHNTLFNEAPEVELKTDFSIDVPFSYESTEVVCTQNGVFSLSKNKYTIGMCGLCPTECMQRVAGLVNLSEDELRIQYGQYIVYTRGNETECAVFTNALSETNKHNLNVFLINGNDYKLVEIDVENTDGIPMECWFDNDRFFIMNKKGIERNDGCLLYVINLDGTFETIDLSLKKMGMSVAPITSGAVYNGIIYNQYCSNEMTTIYRYDLKTNESKKAYAQFYVEKIIADGENIIAIGTIDDIGYIETFDKNMNSISKTEITSSLSQQLRYDIGMANWILFKGKFYGLTETGNNQQSYYTVIDYATGKMEQAVEITMLPSYETNGAAHYIEKDGKLEYLKSYLAYN